MACMLLSQQHLSAIDDIDARGQIPAVLVHRLAQKVVDGGFCCLGCNLMDGGIVAAQFLQFVESAERLVVVIVP